MKKVELLLPGGDINRAKIAINFGADAIYIGAKQYSLRSRACNFTFANIKKIITYAHSHNAKVYIVTNILCHNQMIKNFGMYINKLIKLHPDGFICADPYIMQTIRKKDKNVEIHISTQQSITNSKASLFWKKAVDAKRIVTAREVDFKNLKLMIKNIQKVMDIEYFIHGALCVAFSGHCMLSNNFTLRDANVGGCAQCCRWPCILKDKNNKILANKFTMSLKDICQINNLFSLIKIGVKSFKIEGRMKSEHYVATTCNNYAHAIEDYYSKKMTSDKIRKYYYDLLKAANRDVSIGWFNGHPAQNDMLKHNANKKILQNFVFIVKRKIKNNEYEILSKNFFSRNDKFEVFGRNHSIIKNVKIYDIYDENNAESIDIVNKPMKLYIVNTNNNKIQIGDFGRKL